MSRRIKSAPVRAHNHGGIARYVDVHADLAALRVYVADAVAADDRERAIRNHDLAWETVMLLALKAATCVREPSPFGKVDAQQLAARIEAIAGEFLDVDVGRRRGKHPDTRSALRIVLATVGGLLADWERRFPGATSEVAPDPTHDLGALMTVRENVGILRRLVAQQFRGGELHLRRGDNVPLTVINATINLVDGLRRTGFVDETAEARKHLRETFVRVSKAARKAIPTAKMVALLQSVIAELDTIELLVANEVGRARGEPLFESRKRASARTGAAA